MAAEGFRENIRPEAVSGVRVGRETWVFFGAWRFLRNDGLVRATVIRTETTRKPKRRIFFIREAFYNDCRQTTTVMSNTILAETKNSSPTNSEWCRKYSARLY